MLSFLKDKTFLTIFLSAIGFIISVEVMFYNDKGSGQLFPFNKLSDTSINILDTIVCKSLNEKAIIEYSAISDTLRNNNDTLLGYTIKNNHYPSNAAPKSQKSQIEFFVEYPKFGVWLVLMLIQITLWFSLIIPNLYLLYTYRSNNVWKSLTLNSWQILYNFLLALASMIAMLYVFNHYIYDKEVITYKIFPLAYSTRKIQILTLVGYLVSTLLFTAMLCSGSLLQAQLVKLRKAEGSSLESIKQFISNYQKLRGDFIVILVALGFMLSLMTISTSVCFEATNKLVEKFFRLPEGLSVTIAPQELVASYGLLNSLFLVIFFAPVFTKFYYGGKSINDKIAKSTEISAEEKNALDSEILTNKTQSLFKILLLIISPLLSGILPDLLSGIFK